MNNQELLLQIEEPLLQIRTQINHARVIMQDIMIGYFHDIDKNPNTDEGRMWIARAFKPTCYRAEIVEDAICQIDAELQALELIANKLNEEVYTHDLDHD